MQRIDKVNEMMRREIGTMMQKDFQDPRLAFVSITAVNVSRDLRHARVNFSYPGDSRVISDIEKTLRRIRGYVRKLVGERIHMRYTPEIEFFYDRSIQDNARIAEILEDIKKEKPGSL